ncbi:polyphosphate kinase 1 [Haloferax volcanii]|uniref:Polyphosphate kinase n=4 Tax=Haloferax volcanii TaxID=2246 RepID=A0A384LE49_HALVD|nr:polyphosphate kinase 1 [Haloferax volcanii]ADE04455.1 polyphosphate kinase [Haloferax volcanii DS2]ELY32507.1 polyphosphate kinase [Haloferax volcanii DS2]MBS8118359.1 polyphosphate kinase 1 [Haloferax volcanii]MBS8123372.1 polyphosphate kinase 1 [Haloferax volcanii]MBS8127240.1 polyphosphate kinase 1 [Haloferax volcanii]
MSDDEVRGGDSQGRQAGQGQATAPVRVRDRDDDESNPVDADLADPALYLNRELSELAFHERVLHEARDDRNPLFERVKFLSILTSNLDEFFMKRVGGLKQQMAAGVSEPSPDGRTPSQQWSLVLDRARDLLDRQSDCFHDLVRPALTDAGIDIVGYDDLAPDERAALRDYFEASVLPTLTPLTFEPAHPFPFISNLSLSLAVRTTEGPEEPTKFSRVKVPGNRPRLVNVDERVGDAGGRADDDGPAGPVRFVPLVAVMERNIDLLFPNVEVVDTSAFRVTRNAEVRRNEEVAEGLIATIEDVLRQRRFATVVRLEVQSGTPEVVRDLLAEQLGVDDREVFERDLPLDYGALASLFDLDRPELEVAPWTPQPHPRFAGRSADDPDSVFTEIARKDVLVHHPYHSFTGTVGTFLAAAAADPDVLAIKATIYRTAPDSEVIETLIEAAKNGKQVAVMVELKARFDEENNLRWVRRLEEEGIHVAYGTIGLKTHTKTALVVREEGDEVRLYSHVATGNYHSQTAKLYTDLGLFTADPDIGHDLVRLFNFFTGHSRQETYRKLLVAPTNLREEMTRLVRREADHARAGRDARIVAKMNALEDPAMVRELYEASMAGVDIDLVVRGICRLRPGIEGLSEHVSVSSVVGRFLEHSRIFYFENGGEPDYYVGSADWMTRNLDRRVEAVAPVEDPEHRAELDAVLDALLSDNRRRWVMDSDGRYEQRRPGDGERVREAHRELMDRALGAAYRAGDD